MPVINKIDLASANIELVKEEIEKTIGLDTTDIPLISAKTGLNIGDVLEGIVKNLPAPQGDDQAPLQALIFDSYYDTYRGVVIFISIKQGKIRNKEKIHFFATNSNYDILEMGIRNPNEVLRDELHVGDVAWIAANIKNIKDVHVGDTITSVEFPASEPLSGYRKLTPMVYCGLYPTDNAKYKELYEALDKLSLNDSSLVYEPETSQALGFGFRLGFLGLLHMDIIQERLEREFNLGLIATAPSVIYHIFLTNKTQIDISNPSLMPNPQNIDHIEEPYVIANMYTPEEYIGPLMELSQRKRGIFKDLIVIDSNRRCLVYEIPLSEVIYNFFDKLKSISKGYASLDYTLSEYKTSKLTKMEILLNGNEVDALASIVHVDFAFERGQKLTSKLKDVIPRQLFEVPVQAAINGKVVARTNIKAVRKDVLAKCYGGDITRKKKLLEKQKEGKKRLKLVGSVEVPQSAFMAILQVDDD
jgi:GTP-binding protein LepA